MRIIIKNYNENSNKGYFFEVDVKYSKILFNHHKDFNFTRKRSNQKYEKLICNIKDKKIKKYVVHIRALKQVLNHGLILKKVCRVIQFNQKT